MAIALVMQFEGIGQEKYDAVMVDLGLDNPGGIWPEGIISHFAGSTGAGWCVVDVWESRQAFDEFMASQLGPAIERVGGFPEAQPVEVAVYNAHEESPLGVAAY